MQAKMMKGDPDNHTRWKHKWVWHDRGNVWDKIALEWGGEEDWMSAGKMKSTLANKYKFVTFALDSVKLSTVHQENKGDGKGKTVKEDTEGPGTRGHHHPHTCAEGQVVQISGDSDATCKWINGIFLWDRSTEDELANYKRPCTHGGKGRLPNRFRRLMIS